MPIIIISNIAMIYQFVLHIQYLSVVSAASIPLAHCKAIFATNAFSFDCPHTMYITTNIIIIVEVDFLWDSTVDSLKTHFHLLLWTSSGLKE